ncbi:MAG: glycoside hydrolase family 88 protein, partial [Bacteroidota bacterium]|nr:glycoside hydrolase family 88 protein [Bacteroidota bacterium]
GFFTYSLLWGINHKLLDRNKYRPVIQRSWKALTEAVHEDGMLGYVQPIGAAPNTVTAGSTEIYGVGAFLLAGTELYRCMKH